jgi:hypothetical protein
MFGPSKMAQAITLSTCILEVPSSNLGGDTEYPDSSFAVFLNLATRSVRKTSVIYLLQCPCSTFTCNWCCYRSSAIRNSSLILSPLRSDGPSTSAAVRLITNSRGLAWHNWRTDCGLDAVSEYPWDEGGVEPTQVCGWVSMQVPPTRQLGDLFIISSNALNTGTFL